MLQKLAESIAEITKDYHFEYGHGFKMTPEHILDWADQFDQHDQEFVLGEFLHILNQGVYISRDAAKQKLEIFLEKTVLFFGYKNIETFLRETHFIAVQGEEKSQTVLLLILNEIVNEKIGYQLDICGTLGIRNYIYLDDILGSGRVFSKEIFKYISENNLLEGLKNKKIRILSYFLCIHTWGTGNARYILKHGFEGENLFLDKKAFPIVSDYIIENNIMEYNQRLNLIYPEKTKNEYDVYLVSLDEATRQVDKAYRKPAQPGKESFFSSKDARLRLEQIFLNKGISIINRIQDQSSKKKHRPLGKTYPSYKTFGTGTLFFTWRNISNTCPIVFWWSNEAHNWKGLFPLYKRGG